MVTELHHFIDGHNIAGRSGRFGELRDPATGRLAARVPLAAAAEVDAAVAAARKSVV